VSTPSAAPASPYRGLAAFQDSELDAIFFFGREREAEIIAANLMAYRLTVLYGATGVGKTSVLRAGVAHELRRRSGADPEYVVVVFDRWSGAVVDGLADEALGELRECFGDRVPEPVAGSLADVLGAWSEALGCEIFLILDQAEEYFLYHGREAAARFADEFGELVTRPGLRVNALVALRDDALSKLDRFKSRVPNLLGNYLRLDHLDRGSARRAIEEPLREYNRLTAESVELDPVLVDAVLDQTAAGRIDVDLSGREGAERASRTGRIEAPYLQLVMERLWDEERAAGSKLLRLETLEQLGGAGEIVRRHLVDALDELNAQERDLAATFFNYLVTPSGTKVAHGIADLAGYAAAAPSDVRPVVDRLLGERILRPISSNGEADSGSYEIFHDVLAEPIVAWRAGHLAQRALERQQAEANRRHRRLLLISAAVLLALVAMTAVTVFALVQRSHAHRAASRARTREAESTAARAIEGLPVDPNRSLRLAADAARLRPTPLTEAVLRQALIESHERAILPAGGPVRAAAFSPNGELIVTASDDGRARVYDARTKRLLHVLRPNGPVTTASFSPDGLRVATGGADGPARLWNARSGRLLHALGRGGVVESTAFSSNGRFLITAQDDRAARIWSARTGALKRILPHDGPVLAASFSPNGKRVVTVAKDRAGHHRAYLFDARTGRRVRMLATLGVTRAVFSPDGRLVATASVEKDGGSAAVWRSQTGERVQLLKDHQGHVVDASFSPDGKELVTASEDGAGYVWDVAKGVRRLLLVGPTAAVESATFSPDGKYIVLASRDGTARVYADNGQVVASLAGHRDSVATASFSPNGCFVVTGSDDATARVWDPGTCDRLQVLTRHSGGVLSAAFSADGRVIVSAGADGRVRLTSAATGAQLRVVRQAGLLSAALSHAGRRLVTTASDAPVRIWDISNGRVVRAFRHRGASSASFSPDDSLLATAGRDGKARIWRTSTGHLVAVLRQGRPGDETSAVFGPGGATVATTGFRDGTARIWDASNGRLVHTLHTHQGSVVSAAFSPDGSTVVTAGGDGTARLWSTATGKRLHVLRGHTASLTGAVFSPAGTLLVTAGRDNDARLWDVRTGRDRAVLRQFSPVTAASFSPDGRWILTAGATTAILWQTATGRLFAYLRGHSLRVVPVITASFAPNGTGVLTAGRDGTVRTYVCAICGGVDDLLKLARLREARIVRR
jgi:WD40 repeat protein